MKGKEVRKKKVVKPVDKESTIMDNVSKKAHNEKKNDRKKMY